MNTDNTATLPASTMDTAREISRASDHGQDDKAALRLWLRLLPLTTLVEQELRSRLRQRFGITLPQFDVMAELDRAGDYDQDRNQPEDPRAGRHRTDRG